MPERRAAKRTKMVLPVKISLEGNIAAIYTVDISPFGARWLVCVRNFGPAKPLP